LTGEEKKKYLEDVKKDFEQLKEEYPFSIISIAPTVEITPVVINIIAANRSLIDTMLASPEDFQGDYSRQLRIIVPFDYKEQGCHVFGGKWIDKNLVNSKDMHFHEKMDNGLYRFCVGIPESFPRLQNVILENIRTAENMLIAYEQLQKGLTKTIKLKAYSHGEKGKDEYRRDRKRYRTKY
jgi:hypothetical protein